MARPYKFRNKWRIQWTDERGTRKSQLFKDYKDAEFSLQRHQVQTEEIRRGLRSLAPINRTFSELCDHYLNNVTSQKKQTKDDHSIIAKHLLPFFGKFELSQISRKEIQLFRLSKKELKPKSVHNILTLLSSMLREASAMGWLQKLPEIKKPKISVADMRFSFLKNEVEIHRFLASARAEDDPTVFYMYATAIYTGARAGELAALTWRDISFDRGSILISKSWSSTSTKNGKSRFVTIFDPLMPLLKEWRLRNPLPIVFPNQLGNRLQPSARIFKEVKDRVLHRGGFPSFGNYPYIRFHDLRHTFASLWVRKGGDLFRLQQLLGHSEQKMVQRYAHLSPADYEAFRGIFGSNYQAQQSQIG